MLRGLKNVNLYFEIYWVVFSRLSVIMSGAFVDVYVTSGMLCDGASLSHSRLTNNLMRYRGIK